MLMVSYCYQSLSVVHALSTFCFKPLLLQNGWTDFEIIYRKVPWVTLYQNCSKHSASLNKMAARAENRKKETFNLPDQMFQMALLLIEENDCAKSF